MKILKASIIILCLLCVSTTGSPQFGGGTFFMKYQTPEHIAVELMARTNSFAPGKEEIWKDVVGFEGYYQVSNYGRVKGLKRTCSHRFGKRTVPEKMMAPNRLWTGYHVIGLRVDDGKNYPILVHRIVAEAFIPNPDKKRVVNHKDGIKDNNHVDNLEWATDSENQIHAAANGLNPTRYGSKAGHAKKAIDTTTGIIYGCVKDAYTARGYTRGQYDARKLKEKYAFGIKRLDQ